jgi:hypothetical protein
VDETRKRLTERRLARRQAKTAENRSSVGKIVGFSN